MAWQIDVSCHDFNKAFYFMECPVLYECMKLVDNVIGIHIYWKKYFSDMVIIHSMCVWSEHSYEVWPCILLYYQESNHLCSLEHGLCFVVGSVFKKSQTSYHFTQKYLSLHKKPWDRTTHLHYLQIPDPQKLLDYKYLLLFWTTEFWGNLFSSHR